MTHRTKFSVVLGVVVVVVSGFVWTLHGEPPTANRAIDLTLAKPEWSAARIETSMRDSDRVVATLRSVGAKDARERLAEMLKEAPATDDRLRELYDTNREVFGNRSFEASRTSLDVLFRIHWVRVQLDLPDPNSQIIWPD